MTRSMGWESHEGGWGHKQELMALIRITGRLWEAGMRPVYHTGSCGVVVRASTLKPPNCSLRCFASLLQVFTVKAEDELIVDWIATLLHSP